MSSPPANDDRERLKAAMTTPSGFLALGLGSGLSPKAPGTAGTAMGMVLALPLGGMPAWAGLVAVLVAFVAGVWICDSACRQLGRHDHGAIVWDEFVGIWLVLALVPFEWIWWIAAFVLFRVFDIVKPWPIGWLDRRVHGGLGVMVDDI
ncbi:MAG: phosphatidylglycerophosphatase A, partial [Wenzhouxiangella sp.]